MVGTIIALIVIFGLFSATLLKGGKDHTIRISVPPAATKKGKNIRMKLIIALALIFATAIIIAFASGLSTKQAYVSLAIFIVLLVWGVNGIWGLEHKIGKK